jgi:hypothetical protein
VATGRPGVPSWADAAGANAGDRQPRRSGTTEPAAPIGDDWAETGHVGGSSRAQATLSRVLAYTLWGGIAVALVLGLVNCAGSPAAGPPPAATQAAAAPVPPPGGCAELVVSAWLAGDTEALAGVSGMPRSRPEPGRRQATRTFTAGVTQGDNAWSYLVGADVQVRADEEDTWQSAGTQFFAVTMVPAEDGCQGWRPAALPAQAAAPPLGGTDTAGSPYEVSLPTSGTELGTTLDAFFAGLLAGASDLERYVAPGVVITPVVPPPYEQVSVAELHARDDPTERGTIVPSDGTVLQLLATVDTDAEADDLPLVYPVTMAVRGGRWEVVAIDPQVATAAVTDGSTNGG